MAGLFKKAKTPKLQPPRRIPDQEDPQKLAAIRRRREAQAKSGRGSTVLAEETTSKLGPGS